MVDGYNEAGSVSGQDPEAGSRIFFSQLVFPDLDLHRSPPIPITPPSTHQIPALPQYSSDSKDHSPDLHAPVDVRVEGNLSAATSSRGAAIAATRRFRGRPMGSKNKPKPPIIVTRDSKQSYQSHVLEVSAGVDILESLSNYAKRRGKGICVLSGSGIVANVSLRRPASDSGESVVNLQGRLEILSLSGTVLPPPAPPGAGRLSIFLSGGKGEVIGGCVVAPLVACSGPVVLMAALFSNAVFQRLPLASDEELEEGGGGHQVQSTLSQ